MEGTRTGAWEGFRQSALSHWSKSFPRAVYIKGGA